MLVRPGLPCAATQLDSDTPADAGARPVCYIASQPPAPAMDMQQNLNQNEGALCIAQHMATDTSKFDSLCQMPHSSSCLQVCLEYACDKLNVNDPDPLAVVWENASHLVLSRSTWQRPEQQYKQQCCSNEADRSASDCSTHVAGANLETYTLTA